MECTPLMDQARHLAIFIDSVLIAAAGQSDPPLARCKYGLFIFVLNSVTSSPLHLHALHITSPVLLWASWLLNWCNRSSNVLLDSIRAIRCHCRLANACVYGFRYPAYLQQPSQASWYRGGGGRLDKLSIRMETDPGSRASSSEIKSNPTCQSE